MGSSPHFNRTNFFADGAASEIPEIFEAVDDLFAEKFVEVVKESPILRARIRYPVKLARLRRLALILRNRVSSSFAEKKFLDQIIEPAKEAKFLRELDAD
jgi:hypothetical protein